MLVDNSVFPIAYLYHYVGQYNILDLINENTHNLKDFKEN